MKAAALLFGACALALAPAHAGERMVLVISATQTMPLARFENNQLTGGIVKDLADAMAAKLGRAPAYLVLPRRRAAEALASGEADVRCYLLPHWDNTDAHWSKPLIPNGDVVAVRRGAAAPRALEELAGARLGTVIGYRYPQLEEALGERFMRDDAPSEEHNLGKLAAGRFDYAVVNQLALQHFLKTSKFGSTLAPDSLRLSRFEAPCALSRKSRIPAADFDRAVDELLRQGTMAKILAQYR